MKFKKIYIEITNRCNLACDFCQPHHRHLMFMEPEVFSTILKQIRPYTNYIYLHVMGEPLLHPQLAVILKIAKDVGMHVNITSNCVLLPSKIDVLKGNIRQLNMSLHSLPKQLGIHQENYIEDCLHAGDVLADNKTYISYRMWNMKDGILDVESKQVLTTIEQHYHMPILPGVHQKLAPRRFLHFEETFTWPSLQQPMLGMRGTCYGMRTMCAILVDGSVVPCCLDGRGECVLGNILQQPFEEILAQERSQHMIQGFQNNKLVEPLCMRCGYRQRFDEENDK